MIEQVILPKIVQDAFSTVTTEVASATISKWHRNKIAQMRELLMTEIRQGDLDAVNKDAFLSSLARFYRSVSEGVAKSKLKLLAKLIIGISKTDKKHAKAETFYDYADLLERLTEEEIEFLACCIKKGVIPDGFEEIKQSLQFKGFFVAHTTTEMKNRKGVQIKPENKYPSSARMVNETLILDDQAIPYDVKTVTTYTFSKRFDNLLTRYGNLWEDIAK